MVGFINRVCDLTISGQVTRAQEAVIWTKLNEYKGQSVYASYVWEIVMLYDGIVHSIVKEIKLGSYPYDDAITDAQDLLYDAVTNYDINKGASFATYAMHPYTIKCRLIDIVKKYHRHKGESLDSVISRGDDKEITLMDTIASTDDPEEYLMNRRLKEAYMKLTPEERRVVHLVANYGESRDVGMQLYPDVANEATRRQKVHREYKRLTEKLRAMMESEVIA